MGNDKKTLKLLSLDDKKQLDKCLEFTWKELDRRPYDLSFTEAVFRLKTLHKKLSKATNIWLEK